MNKYDSFDLKFNDTSTKLNVEFGNSIAEIPYDKPASNSSNFIKYIKKSKYRIQFIISIFVATIFLIIFFYHIQKSASQEKISKKLLNNYTLTTLYQSRNLEISEPEKQSVIIENPFVIGMIKIKKINLNYPILSESSYELLKISLCRFAGPMPNEKGNLCIAGHNYVDNKFFSRLAELEKSDVIEIYDLTGKKVEYLVSKKYEVAPTDLSCTNQDVLDEKVITLITCNNVNGKRTVIRAIEQTF